MNSELRKTARIAGILYLLNAITAAAGLIAIPGMLVIPGDTEQTAVLLRANDFLFRLGIFCSFSSQVVFLFLALVLYRLFEQVNLYRARVLLSLVIASVPFGIYLVFNQATAFFLLADVYQSPAEQALAYVQAASQLGLFTSGITLIGIFWGLWLIPFGQLVIRSGFLPRFAGMLLIMGGVSYLIDTAVFILLPQFHWYSNILVAVLSAVAEFTMIILLLVKGIKRVHEPV